MNFQQSIKRFVSKVRLTFMMYLVILVIALLILSESFAAQLNTPSVPARSEEVLLQQADFKYVGAFRVPRGDFGGSSFGYSGAALAFNPNRPKDRSDDTLFISGHAHNPGFVAEISIPNPVNSENLADLSVSKVLQDFADATDGKMNQIVASNRIDLAGLLVHRGRLIWTALSYYDASHKADRSHGTSSLNLSEPDDTQGIFRVGKMNPGFVAGYMADVPRTWQARLGAPLLTGQCNMPIVTRTSAGPAAIGFNPENFSSGRITPAIPFMFNGHLKEMKSKNKNFNFNSSIGGMVFPDATRSIIYFGGHATGEVCYGTSKECNDPDRPYKGWHDRGGHYVYQAWAYDAKDFLAVKQGRLAPEQVRPYTIWNPEFPITVPHARVGGVGYDQTNNQVFLVQLGTDRGTTGRRSPQPIIHVFEIQRR